MAERLPRYQQTGIQIDPYRPAGMPSIDYSPIMRESKNLAAAQQGVLDRVINFAGKIGMEQAGEQGRAAVDTPEKAKQVLQITKETGMPRSQFDKAAYEQANELVILQLQNDGRRLNQELVNEFKRDPNADPNIFLQKSIGIRDGLESLADLVDPKLRGRIGADLDRVKNYSYLEISERHNDRVAQQLKATTLAGIEQRSQDAIRIMPTGIADGERMLFKELQEIKKYAIAGNFSPLEIERQLQSVGEQAHMARFRKSYEQAKDKIGFLKEVRADLGRGPIGELYDQEGTPLKNNRITRGIDVNKMGALVNEIESDIRSRNAQFTALRSELKTDVAELTRIFSLGQIPTVGVVAEISKRARDLGLPENDATMRQVNYLGNLRQNSITFNKMSPIELGQEIRKLQNEVDKGATLEQSLLLDVAKKAYTHKDNMLKSDPVSYMNQTGAAEVQTLNFALAPVDLIKQISARRTQLNSFSVSMGSDAKYFTEDEANSLSTFLQKSTPDEQIGLLGIFTKGFGTDTPAALRQISKFAPEFAHVGGLTVLGNVNNKTMFDALNGAKQRQTGVKPFEGTGDAATRKNTLADELGSAYAVSFETRAALITTAENIYDYRATMSGKSTFDESMFRKAIQEAAGVKNQNGKLFGGIIEYQGNRIPIPNTVAQEDFSSLMRKATYEDFVAASNGAPMDKNGRAYTIERLKKGYPIYVDDVKAKWSYENPKTFTGITPLGFVTKNGVDLEVDIKILMTRIKEREDQKIAPFGSIEPVRAP